MKRAMTQEAKDARASEILDAAEKMLLTTDYKDLKMSEIARAAGISSGLIFTYFKTKETLFLSLLWREFEKRVEYLEKVIAESRPAGFDGIRRLVLAELEHVLYESPVYIKLEPMRPSILEKNVEPEFLSAMQKRLSAKVIGLCEMLSRGGSVTQDDVLEQVAREAGIDCFRGDEDNVLDRFIRAAEAFGLDRFIRVCSDNPFLRPDTFQTFFDAFDKEPADYIAYGFADGRPTIKSHIGLFAEP